MLGLKRSTFLSSASPLAVSASGFGAVGKKSSESPVDEWLNKLLDFSPANPLLNVEKCKARIYFGPLKNGLEKVLECLDTNGTVSIKPSRKKVECIRDKVSNEFCIKPVSNTVNKVKYTSLTFEDTAKELTTTAQSNCAVEEIEKEFTTLCRDQNTNMEESGENTLFLALGMLSWEDKELNKRCTAPLILLPVELFRKKPRQRNVYFNLRQLEQPTYNGTLINKLKGMDINLSLRLPKNGESIIDYVNDIWKTAKANTADLQLNEFQFEVVEELVLSNFSFSKYLMWKDLKGLNACGKLKKSKFINHLINNLNGHYPDKVDVKKDYDPQIQDFYAPLNADHSQRIAIAESANGKDFVLQGPPGTGKSETIANMIAHNIARERKVLFVSEKMAALDVVYERMKNIGLNHLCLELHSEKKSARQKVIEQIKEAFFTHENQQQGNKEDLAKNVEHFEELRKLLEPYMQKLHEDRFPDYSHKDLVCSCYGAVSKVASAEDSQFKLNWGRDINNSPARKKGEKPLGIRKAVGTLGSAYSKVAGLKKATLSALSIVNCTDCNGEELRSTAKKLNAALGEYQKCLKEFLESCGDYQKCLKKFLKCKESEITLSNSAEVVKVAGGCLVSDGDTKSSKMDKKTKTYRLVLNGLLKKHESLFEKECSKLSKLGISVENPDPILSAILEMPIGDLKSQWESVQKKGCFKRWWEKRKIKKKIAALSKKLGFDRKEPVRFHRKVKKELPDNLALYAKLKELAQEELKELAQEERKMALTANDCKAFLVELKKFSEGNGLSDDGILLKLPLNAWMKIKKSVDNGLPKELFLIGLPSLGLVSYGYYSYGDFLYPLLIKLEELSNVLLRFGELTFWGVAFAGLSKWLLSRRKKKALRKINAINTALKLGVDLKLEDVEKTWEFLGTLLDACVKSKEKPDSSLKEKLDSHLKERFQEAKKRFQDATSNGSEDSNSLIESIMGSHELRESASKLREAHLKLSAILDQFKQAGASGIEKKPFEELEAALSALSKLDDNDLRNWCGWVKAQQKAYDFNLQELITALKTGKVVKPGQEANVAAKAVQNQFDIALCKWLVGVLEEEEYLDSDEHANGIESFRERDKALIESTRKHIIAKLANKFTNAHGNCVDIQRQIQGAERRLSVRDIIEIEGKHLLDIMPCFMMSPMSVAQYLPIDFEFDLVIFDEASQITVEDAIGAIARGTNVIVVGDLKQMPPINRFKKSSDDNDDNDDNDSIQSKSILEKASGVLVASQLKLEGHYRSRHESLIDFSNHKYYDGKLITYPSPETKKSAVIWHPVNGFRIDGGKHKGANNEEADAVVAEVDRRLNDEHLKKQSIGIVTLNAPQRDLIKDKLSNKGISDEGNGEHSVNFVHNLDEVQGHESDVILLSIGHGPTEKARCKVTSNLGSLNSVGGERRLNVAITRAKTEMRVFSSFPPSAIESESQGIKHLIAYIKQAELDSKAFEDLKESVKNSDSSFKDLKKSVKNSDSSIWSKFIQEQKKKSNNSAGEEQARKSVDGSHKSVKRQIKSGQSNNFAGGEQAAKPVDGLVKAVARELEDKGWTVERHIGLSDKYYIDLGVVHPDDENSYLAGVECDGASYESYPSARDRHIIRQNILKARGWNLIQIRSVEYHRNSDKIIKAVHADLVKLHTGCPQSGSAERGLSGGKKKPG